MRIFPCVLCQQVFETRRQLKAHNRRICRSKRKVVKIEHGLKCYVCNAEFFKKEETDGHVATEHPGVVFVEVEGVSVA